jgi:hypothetical protein
VKGPGRPGKTAAVLVGGAAAFVVALRVLQAIRPALLLDTDPGWLLPRVLLWLGLFSAAGAAGVVTAALFFLWSRSRFCPDEPRPLPFRRSTIVLLALAALVAGALVRFAWLDTLPIPLWLDDVSLIEPALALEGKWRDFENAIRPAPYGVAEPFGSVGVLYLELYRLSLELAGTNVFGVRLPSALAGAVSVFTAMLLGRSLLPRGGGALAGLALAGMRWSLILSRWGWNAIVLAPILDVAALLLIAARRRRSLLLAGAAGLVAGLSTHIYLASWVGAAALFLIAGWPGAREEGRDWRPGLAAVFAVAFAVAALPIFLLGEGRTSPYFARASDQNVVLEVERAKSPLPVFAAAADALAAPWFLSDPTPRHDLPGRSRLGWIGGSLAAVALAFAVLRPRRDLSAYLLANAAAAFAASVVGGRATAPNGYRFGYLANVSAVAIAAGAALVIGAAPLSRRRAAAMVLVGAIAVASAAGTRDALVRWAESRTTFDDFWGEDTLLARAVSRWEAYGSVELDPELGKNPLTIAGARRYRLDPDRRTEAVGGSPSERGFRVVAPGTPGLDRERLVERVGDPWGRDWAWVYGRRRQEDERNPAISPLSLLRRQVAPLPQAADRVSPVLALSLGGLRDLRVLLRRGPPVARVLEDAPREVRD